MRPFNGCDINALVPLSNHKEIAQNLALKPYPYTELDAADFVFSANEMGDCGAIFAIELKETGALIGCCGYGPSSDIVGREGTVFWDSTREHEHLYNLPDLGYWLGVAYWNKGYATEAARAMAGHAFDVLGLKELGAAFHKSNPASGRVLEKVGFERIGEERQHSLGAGKVLETFLLHLPRDRWRRLHASLA